jgi:hypothetical protein
MIGAIKFPNDTRAFTRAITIMMLSLTPDPHSAYIPVLCPVECVVAAELAIQTFGALNIFCDIGKVIRHNCSSNISVPTSMQHSSSSGDVPSSTDAFACSFFFNQSGLRCSLWGFLQHLLSKLLGLPQCPWIRLFPRRVARFHFPLSLAFSFLLGHSCAICPFLEHMKQTPFLNDMSAISPSSFASFLIPPPIARHCISVAAERWWSLRLFPCLNCSDVSAHVYIAGACDITTAMNSV